MSLTQKMLPLLALSLFMCFGFTDCAQFKEVTVPPAANDTTPPTIVNSVLVGRTYEVPAINDTTDYRLSGFDDKVVAVSSAMDQGGVEELHATYQFIVRCCAYGGDYCQSPRTYESTYEDTQTGSTGSTVSSGIYWANPIKPRDVVNRYCTNPRFKSEYSDVELRWRTEAWDFKGSRSSTGWSSIVYDR